MQDTPNLQITSSDPEICLGEQVVLSALGAQTYSWSNNLIGNPVIVTPTTTTTYYVTGTIGVNCSNTSSITIYVYTLPIADFSYLISEHSPSVATVQFYDQSSGNPIIWFWNFDDGNTSSNQNPTHFYPLQNQNYWVSLYIENQYGCSDSITKLITIRYEPEYTIFIPNAFSPADDALNTYFSIFHNNLLETDFRIIIFDRWGKIIFESDDINFKWDGKTSNGKLAPQGLYVYKINFKDASSRKHAIYGFVNIIY